MSELKSIKLVLENGTEFIGKSFGYSGSVSGEVVFNTSMTGYPESLTDPSFYGQILVSTYPLIGNYGVPDQIIKNRIIQNFESEKVQVAGLVILDYSDYYSHYTAKESLGAWLKRQHVPGIFGLDTRALTKILRNHGSMPGKIIYNDDDIRFYDPNKINLLKYVSTTKRQVYGNGRYKILLIDCGVKLNIIRCLLKKNTTVICVPWNYDIKNESYDGLIISNGPGNPEVYTTVIDHVKTAFQIGKPVFGICLGNQIMALAGGARTFKLKFGHRSHNQPVLKTGTNRCYITSQNHGFGVRADTLPADWETLFTNVNDQTCEGIVHRSKPFFATQFHPEASGGPTDTEFLFDYFIDLIK